MSAHVNGWMKPTYSNGKAHWMRWIAICGYWQPLCKQSSDSDFYGEKIVAPSLHNKCRQCEKAQKATP